MKGYYISRLQSGKQNHYECCGIRDLLQEQVTSHLWEKLEKSPKGGVGGSENVTNQPALWKLSAVGQLSLEVGSKVSLAAEGNPRGEQVETSMEDCCHCTW